MKPLRFEPLSLTRYGGMLTTPPHQTHGGLQHPRLGQSSLPQEVQQLLQGPLHVVTPPGLTLSDQDVKGLLSDIVQAHKIARRHKVFVTGTQDKSNGVNGDMYGAWEFLGSVVTMNNGVKATATNFEPNAYNVTCAERAAMIRGLNQGIEQMEDRFFQESTLAPQVKPQLKIKQLVISSSRPLGSHFDSFCFECLKWFSNPDYCEPSARVASLVKDPKGQWVLEVRRISDILPLLGETGPSVTGQRINQLPVALSDSARQIIESGGVRLDRPTLNHLMVMARQSYYDNQSVKFPERNYATSVLFDSGQAMTRSRFDFKRRLAYRPELRAIADGIQYNQSSDLVGPYRSTWWTRPQFYMRQTQKASMNALGLDLTGPDPYRAGQVKLICYYGNYKDIPAVDSIAMLASFPPAGLNTLIAVIRDNRINVRTIGDYIKQFHQADAHLTY